MVTIATQDLYDALVTAVVDGTSATAYPMRVASDVSDVLNAPKPGIDGSFCIEIAESNARDMDAVDGFYTNALSIRVIFVWPVKRRAASDKSDLYERQPLVRSAIQQRFNAGQGATGGLLCKVWWTRNTAPQRATPDYWMVTMDFEAQVEQAR